jgi:Cu-Zn family superoxide dismutase
MKKFVLPAVVLTTCFALAEDKPSKLTVQLKDTKGNAVGTATIGKPFMRMGKGTRIALDVKGLKPGVHAIHIHENAKCEGPEFKSAGAHLNPTKAKHPQHLGDLPNFNVKADGTSKDKVSSKMQIDDLLKNKSGSSLVVHEKADDMKTDPAGNSGARVACGIIAAK